jgi:hypothetical protein
MILNVSRGGGCEKFDVIRSGVMYIMLRMRVFVVEVHVAGCQKEALGSFLLGRRLWL